MVYRSKPERVNKLKSTTTMRLLLSLVMLLSGLALTAQQQTDTRDAFHYSMQKIADPIVIDGNQDESAWDSVWEAAGSEASVDWLLANSAPWGESSLNIIRTTTKPTRTMRATAANSSCGFCQASSGG